MSDTPTHNDNDRQSPGKVVNEGNVPKNRMDGEKSDNSKNPAKSGQLSVPSGTGNDATSKFKIPKIDKRKASKKQPAKNAKPRVKAKYKRPVSSDSDSRKSDHDSECSNDDSPSRSLNDEFSEYVLDSDFGGSIVSERKRSRSRSRSRSYTSRSRSRSSSDSDTDRRRRRRSRSPERKRRRKHKSRSKSQSHKGRDFYTPRKESEAKSWRLSGDCRDYAKSQFNKYYNEPTMKSTVEKNPRPSHSFLDNPKMDRDITYAVNRHPYRKAVSFQMRRDKRQIPVRKFCA